MRLADQHRLTGVLGIAVVLLGTLWLAMLLGLGRGVRWNAPRPLAPLATLGRAAHAAPMQPPLAVAPVWQHSLFSPDRKPEAHAASGGSSLGDLELTGIIVTPRLRMALLRESKGGAELRLAEGQALPDGSLRLVEVKARSAILDTTQGRVEMKLPAGAPIDVQKAAGGKPVADTTPAGVAEVHRVTSMGRPAALPPPAPPPQYNSQQIERLRRLKAAVMQRRAAAEGAH